MDIYIDGEPQTMFYDGSGGGLQYNQNNAGIGLTSVNTIRYVNATFDDFIFFNRSLSFDEVQFLYNMQLQKINNSRWFMSINQTLNSTAALTDDTYTYQAFAKDLGNNINQTKQRTVNIQADVVAPT